MFEVLNNSKFFAGLTMLAVNLGSKYLAHELSDSQQELFNNKIIRRKVFTRKSKLITNSNFLSQ